MNSRECAVKALYEVEQNGAYSDKALKAILKSSNLSALDRAFATELVYGVIKNKTRIDYIIKAYSKERLKKLSVWILNILRISVYQIIFLDKIPQSAAVNEGVNLAKRYGHSASANFVNGVLRSVCKGGDVSYPNGKENLSIYFSHPQWLVDMLTEQYGEDCAKRILKFNNLSPATTIRVNTLLTSKEALMHTLQEKGINVSETDCENILEISKYGDISALDEYKFGLFTPQDKGAYLCAKEINSQKGDFIIDLCAAPGGKTTQIAEMCGDTSNITAFDVFPHKLDLINKNAKRLGIKNITTKLNDASILQNEYIKKADKVLADVPCSGLGIIRKKPDIKWNKTPEDIKEIINLQRKILQTGSEYVKKGGILVYSTCTLNKMENSGVTHEFAKNNNFNILKETTLLPHENNCDGFYICTMEKAL